MSLSAPGCLGGISGTSETGSAPGFPHFRLLPPELRSMIWREVLLAAYGDRAAIILGGYTVLASDDHVEDEAASVGLARVQRQTVRITSEMLPCSAFLVNRESRRVAKALYSVCLPICCTAVAAPALHRGVAANGGRSATHSPFSTGPLGYVHVSPALDYFVLINDHKVRDEYAYQPNAWFDPQPPTCLQKAAGHEKIPAWTVGIKNLLVVTWDNFRDFDKPEYFTDAAELSVDPLMDLAFGQYSDRIHLYIHQDRYPADRNLLNHKGWGSVTELLDRYPGQSHRVPPLINIA
ncbi:hypothetical protein PG999_012697 [Apiospora kogelbergensis]|uniref:2EXR domain-containing protein n=1 Tax=Apiospora kogelbergensis TaxID=1337665 RepID=A0AAW0QDC3_9PEZI